MIKQFLKKLTKSIYRPKAKQFKTHAEYYAWYYRARERWLAGFKREMKNLKKAREAGFKFRMAEIARRKTLTLEQRRKEKAVRQREAIKAHERGRERRAKLKQAMAI